MSKHIFDQRIEGQLYEVQIGWDKPLQAFYGVISPWVEREEEGEEGYFDDPIWSNLNYDKKLTLEEIADACRTRGFIIPEGLLENVGADQRRNAVNEVTFYDENDLPIDPLSPGF